MGGILTGSSSTAQAFSQGADSLGGRAANCLLAVKSRRIFLLCDQGDFFMALKQFGVRATNCLRAIKKTLRVFF